MSIVLDFFVGLALLLLVGGFVFRTGRRRVSDSREALMNRRVEAYMETIRRERSNPELRAMSDDELRDVLLSGARNLAIENERRWYALLGAGVVAVMVALLVATQNGLQGFGIALVVGAIVLLALNEIFVRRSREPLLARGIDVDRLRVE